MTLTKQQALDLFRSDDLIGIGMEADAVRRKLHPEGVATYIIDRNGIVVFSYVDADYTTRLEPTEIAVALAHLRVKANPSSGIEHSGSE